MALTLLDFTDASVDLMITLPGGGSASDYKCVIQDLTWTIRREMQSRRTICSGPWEARVAQSKQCFITATKFASKGVAISDPLVLFSGSDPLAVTFTAFTGCTLVGNYQPVSDGMGGAAGGVNFGGTLTLESSGAQSSTWVVT